MAAELLTVRLNSVNEILALQEEKMVKQVSVCSSHGNVSYRPMLITHDEQ